MRETILQSALSREKSAAWVAAIADRLRSPYALGLAIPRCPDNGVGSVYFGPNLFGIYCGSFTLLLHKSEIFRVRRTAELIQTRLVN